MPSWYASPNDELAALARAVTLVGCRIVSLDVGPTRDGPHAVGQLECSNGWQAARLLLALAIEDSKSPGGRELAQRLRAVAPGDGDFARTLHAFVRKNVRFVRERGEVFTGGGYTLAVGFGDCDDHARLLVALALAGGLPAQLAFLHSGGDPKHVVGQVGVAGSWEWAETTIDARYAENPLEAVDRLGIAQGRTDIARQVVTMSEKDLRTPPTGFAGHSTPEQVKLDSEALSRLGYIAACDAGIGDPTDMKFRRAVLALQVATGITADGLIGPQTRGTIAAHLPPGDFATDYRRAIGQPSHVMGAPAPTTALYTHAMARESLRRAFPVVLGREASENELDFGLAVAWGETNYGRAPGQFAKWAAQSLYNWGALEKGHPPCPEQASYFGHYPNVPGTPATMGSGADAGRPVCFFLFASDDLAAQAFLRAWGATDTLAAAASGSASAVSASMKRHGYYEGFHRPPGGITGSYKSPPFVEEASAEIAEEKNIADYASLISRGVRAVKGSGGIADPGGGAVPGGASSLALLLLAGAALGAAAVGGWRYFA